MYAHSLLMTWVLGIGLFPITAASFALGCKGLMNAGFGARFLPDDFLVALFAVFLRAAGRFAVFLAAFFLPAVFFLVAIASLPNWVRTVLCLGTNKNYREQQ
jgi:hypothetical protein